MTTTQIGGVCAWVLQPEIISKLYFSQLPWLEKHGTIGDFSQGKIAEIIQHQRKAKKKQNLFIALSIAVPRYLPSR